MSEITVQEISRLREKTGVGIVNAKKALVEANGDFDKAIEVIRKSGQKVAESKMSRVMREGYIGHYVHSNGKCAALVVVTCESDFVSASEPFRELIHDLAVHIAAANPRYLKPEDVPFEVLDKERDVARAQIAEAKKPAAIAEKIIEGKLEKFYEEHCLLHQKYIKDDSMSITDLINGAIQKLGENIQVREFVRVSL